MKKNKNAIKRIEAAERKIYEFVSKWESLDFSKIKSKDELKKIIEPFWLGSIEASFHLGIAKTSLEN